jgi:uncharacterized protein YjbI with pentapeptide repeats
MAAVPTAQPCDLRDANLEPLALEPGRAYPTNLENAQIRCADLRGAKLR